MFCNLTKEFLSKNSVAFTERNVVAEPGAIEELRTLGFMTTPVTKIDGDIVVGFDESRLRQLLGV